MRVVYVRLVDVVRIGLSLGLFRAMGPAPTTFVDTRGVSMIVWKASQYAVIISVRMAIVGGSLWCAKTIAFCAIVNSVDVES